MSLIMSEILPEQAASTFDFDMLYFMCRCRHIIRAACGHRYMSVAGVDSDDKPQDATLRRRFDSKAKHRVSARQGAKMSPRWLPAIRSSRGWNVFSR